MRTVVTREPEWDDQERNLMLALGQFEVESCNGCGYHESLTDPNNPANVFTPESRKCPVCAGMDRYVRVQSANDEAAEKAMGRDPSPQTARPGDGRSTFMRPMSPDEVVAARSAPAPTGDQRPRRR